MDSSKQMLVDYLRNSACVAEGGKNFRNFTNKHLIYVIKSNKPKLTSFLLFYRFVDRCNTAKMRPPHGIQVRKGALHIAVTRSYVNYSLHDERAHDILKWAEKACYIPDEIYFSTLNHNPHLGVPGSYKGTCIFPSFRNVRGKVFWCHFKNSCYTDYIFRLAEYF